MQKSILIVGILTFSCKAMQNSTPASPAELLPADVVSIIFCNFISQQPQTSLEELEQAKQKSITAIAALKNAQLVCKRWRTVAARPPVTQHFLEHLAYDSQCGIYTSKPESLDFLSKLHSNVQTVIHNSLSPFVDEAALNYFLNHESTDQLHHDIKRRIRSEGKVPFRNYEEIHRAYLYFEQQANKTYKPLFAALNLNTKNSRAWACAHLSSNPQKAPLVMVLACLFGKTRMVQELLQAGVSPNSPSDDIKMPKPLHIAIAYNQAEVVQALLKSPHLKTNELDWNQECPLAKALHLAKSKVIRILVDNPRVDILSVPATSSRVPSHFRNESHNALWYISQFCGYVDQETVNYITRKVYERCRESYGPGLPDL